MAVDCGGFDWSALATFAAGLIAVGGAVYVGRRQVAIASSQAEILSRQAATAELKLRYDLFDRRWKVYEATREFLRVIMTKADEPPAEVQQEFLWAHVESEYLFAPEVHEKLQEVWSKSCHFFAIVSMMRHNFDTTGAYGAKEIQEKHDYLLWLADRLTHLSDIFGDDLKIGQLGPRKLSSELD